MSQVVFCTTCRNRAAHLKLTLPVNLCTNPKSKFVVLNYNTEDDLADYIGAEFEDEVKEGRLVLYTNNEPSRFHMAHAKNQAHRLGTLEGGDILVNLDADNLAGEQFEDFVSREFAATPGIFLMARMLKGKLSRGIAGRIVVDRNAFLKAGGYDEGKYSDWGPDDKDLNVRLRMLGYEGIEIPPSFLQSIPHTDRMRFKEYPHLANYANGVEFDVNLGTVERAIVNPAGHGLGTVYRNFDPKPIYLRPLPTRIFGIGLHKTATVSLHEAFRILGFESWHWSSAHTAKAIWQQMNNAGHSPTLERFYALSDLPIPLLYQKLDVAYPGAKFILTVRNEGNWLETVRKHWHPRFNRFRAGWDEDPFSNRVHQILYGRTDFDADTMLMRYRRHNSEVLEYFKDRPNDLLLMDMDRGAGWEKLCLFLDQPVPDVPYPHLYQTEAL